MTLYTRVYVYAPNVFVDVASVNVRRVCFSSMWNNGLAMKFSFVFYFECHFPVKNAYYSFAFSSHICCFISFRVIILIALRLLSGSIQIQWHF